MNGMVNTIMQQYLRVRLRRVEHYMRHPEETQELWLQKLLDTAKNTEFGQKYNFADIQNVEQYARTVPVSDYDSFKSDIGRMMRGERDVLWPGEINWYAKSSGTTGDKSKFIPVPFCNLQECHIRGAWDSLAMLYDNKPDIGIFKYKNLVMSGSHSALPDYPKTRFGDVSSILVSHMPAIGRMFYAPDIETALIANFEEKIARTVELTSQRDDIGMFGGVPTWVIVLFRMILEKTGKQNMLEVWPNLQAYMHGGVGFEPYRKTFQELIPSDDFVYQEIYNASEGYFGAQADLGQKDMLLLADNGVFYEFIPVDEWGNEFPKTVTLAGIEIGKNYAILISANNGLWRYQPGDTVVFTRKYPHCFRITGRTKQFINAFGEEVMIGDTDKANRCRRGRIYRRAHLFFRRQGQGRARMGDRI